MSNALYELALNTEVQDKLRQEIRENYNKNDGKLKYEHINEMTYLDLVFRGAYIFFTINLSLIRRKANYEVNNTNEK